MKLHEKSSCRFVREYCNYKISILTDLAKSHPDDLKSEMLMSRAKSIEHFYNQWRNGYIMTDEMMRLIADA